MGKIGKTFTFLFIVLLSIPIAALQPHFAEAQYNSKNSAPAIEWQRVYGQWNIEHSSNLVQTNDSGFIFMDTGSQYQGKIKPATIYKLDLSGNTQWIKTIDTFVGDVIIQTSDGGYEITGKWSAYTPTLIKMDSQGNIQWVQNYSRVPSLGISGRMQFWEEYNATPSQPLLQTSDGGFVYWSLGQIAKTDSANRTQWVENFSYSEKFPSFSRVPIYWLIETSDGALAFLGVPKALETNRFSGSIYLYKTEPFLPIPQPIQLPTPLPAPTTSLTPTPPSTDSMSSQLTIPIIVVVGLTILVSLTLLFRRHRKTAS